MKSLSFVLGTMTFGSQVGERDAELIVKTFLDHGYKEIDTAFRYTGGKSEEILGRILTPSLRDKVYLATKVFPEEPFGFQPCQIVNQVETSLSRLQTDCIDLLYLHRPDNKTPIAVTLGACKDLYQQGKFRCLGLSNYSSWQVTDIWHICKQIGWVTPVTYQGVYNALTRRVELELFPSLRNFGIRFNAYNPLAGGFLTGKYREFHNIPKNGRFFNKKQYQERYWKQSYFNALEEIRETCSRYGISIAEASLRWLKHHSLIESSYNDGIIIGVTNIDQLKANLNTCTAPKLPHELVNAYENAWKVTRLDCPQYFS